MAKVHVTLSESAMRDLEEILHWYQREQVPDVGRCLVGEIMDRAERLADNPELGRIVPEFDQKHLRELIHPPFRIVYQRESHRVRIVRVWRSERSLRLSQPPADESKA
jgi:plasmid stabilization system protein ParE